MLLTHRTPTIYVHTVSYAPRVEASSNRLIDSFSGHSEFTPTLHPTDETEDGNSNTNWAVQDTPFRSFRQLTKLHLKLTFLRPEDYILIYQTELGSIAVETSLSGETVRLQTEMRYANGWPHHIIYRREDGHVSLQVGTQYTETELGYILGDCL